MDREYIVKKTENGFLVRFGHREKSYSEENMAVARNLRELSKIIREDLEWTEAQG